MGVKVEIVKTATDEVVEKMDAGSWVAAERIERGANINLNHAEYHTRIVEK